MTQPVIVPCPPLCDYPLAPEDQSHCELFDCPKCKNKMWLSQKKKGVLMYSSLIKKNIVLGCYNCITKMAHENPSLILGAEQVNL